MAAFDSDAFDTEAFSTDAFDFDSVGGGAATAMATHLSIRVGFTFSIMLFLLCIPL